jgi:type IV pilus assembly protein PilA
MFCYSCGASLPDKTEFCSNCGRPAQGPAPGQGSTPQGQSASSSPGTAAQPIPAPSSAGSAGQPPAQGAPSAWQNVPPMGQPYAGQPQAVRQAYYVEPQTDGKATGSLILGILSLVCFSFFAGIPAVILGHISRKNIRQSMGRLKGDGMALAGLIMGYISIASIPLVLIIAAIAIPNLLRAKISANESAAASTVRTLNTAQVTYQTEYPAKGYARDLATLGPGSSGTCGTPSQDTACLIDAPLANLNEKGGFRYTLTATCGTDDVCNDYVVLATPLSSATGGRSFCSTSDAIIRYKRGEPITSSLSTEDCQQWAPVR